MSAHWWDALMGAVPDLITTDAQRIEDWRKGEST